MFKKDNNYYTPLRDLSEDDIDHAVKRFLEYLINDLSVSIDKEKAIYIYNRVIDLIHRTNISRKGLSKIHMQIISNYKWYTPFCYAAILSAYHETKKEKV